MSPYRTLPPSEQTDREDPFRASTLFAVVVMLLAALRIVVAIVDNERCGADVGIATVVAMLAGRAVVVRKSSKTPPISPRSPN
jgi:hypothetical protein